MAPYRTVDREERAEPPRDQGIVGDVTAQFADSLAFYRELIQNSIDAGTPSVEVRLVYDEPAGVMRAQVRDRGEGMSREVVENQLLVLFRSTKEKDESKIGKFGIGFKSVLAPKPNIVVVQTSRAGRRLTLHLHPDLTYELYDAGAATQTGTSVELELAMPREAVDAFVRDSRAALVRWCRHASVPIEFVAQLVDGEPLDGRIDRPLALDNAIVEVRGTTDDGKLTAIVGLVEDAPTTGFFNHGLMLHESSEQLIRGLAIKIQDSRLGHTLSRDNVRRDDRYDRAVAYARELAETQLVAAVARELAIRAEAVELRPYYQLVSAIETAELELRPAEWVFPLIATGEPRSIRASDVPRRAWAAAQPSPVTELLAARSIPVLHMSTESRNWLVSRAGRSASAQILDATEELTAVTLVPPADSDHAWLGLLGELLDATFRRPASISLAQLTGRLAHNLALTGGVGDAFVAATADRFALAAEQALRHPFGTLVRLPLLLSVTHPFVLSARAGDPRLAASHLARALLLYYGKLDATRSARLLELTLDRLGGT